MKKIGFIDYYLAEWHADNYPKWIAESPANASGYTVAYAYGEKDSPQGVSSETWCSRNGAALCGSIEEVCEKSDCLVILSPDNAEKHLEYARKVLPYGKTTYVDKTFTPSLKEAQELFTLAEKYRTPVCSSSALRFAEEIGQFREAKSVITIGPGPSFTTYAVHQMEIITKVMGTGAEKIMAVQNSQNITLAIQFKDSRRAVYNQPLNSEAPFTVCVETGAPGEVCYKALTTDFFRQFIDNLIRYFDTRAPLAEKQETLSIIALIEAGEQALGKPLEWIPVAQVS
jgi:peroxiredoxin